MHIPRLFLAIVSISFFWAIGAILAAQFPPLVKNALAADNTVATLFTAIFSVGVAIGSIVVNRLLKGRVSARYSPGSVIVMGLFVLDLWWSVNGWPHRDGMLMNWRERSEEHTSELQSLMRSSYAVFCLKKKNKTQHTTVLAQKTTDGYRHRHQTHKGKNTQSNKQNTAQS